MSRAKAMGTAVETAAVRWLQQSGFPEAERLVLAGSADRGDIRIMRYPLTIVECKRGQRGIKLTPWMTELGREVANSGARYGLLVSKQAGAGDRRVARWFAAMEEWMFLALAEESEAGPEVKDLSPTALNRDYVPRLYCNQVRSPMWSGSGPEVPFGVTYTPGRASMRMVVGPFEQFAKMLEAVKGGS